MKQSYQEYQAMMVAKYPKLLGGRFGGFSIEEGWWPIIDALCGTIQNYVDAQNYEQARTGGEEFKQPVVVQIKEKFGSLRFHVNDADERILGMILMAETWASKTCEFCGKPAVGRRTGWIKTVCDEHMRNDNEDQ